MKLSEMEKLTLGQLGPEDVIIVNTVTDDKKVVKKPIYTSSIATKEEVGTIASQGNQLLKLISTMTTEIKKLKINISNLEKENASLKETINDIVNNHLVTY